MTRPDPSGRKPDPKVKAELERVAAMPIIQLRARYREQFRTDPPRAFGPDLLRRSVAHQIQVKAYGGLPRPVQRQLDQLIKAYLAKPTGRLVLPPRIKPGSILVRNWKKKTYRVTVMAGGFAYDGITYDNLSEIAVLITGTRWNGPRFFGLRTKQEDPAEPPSRAPPLSGGSDYRKRTALLKPECKSGRAQPHGH
jgi:hypothetical protein